jgi:hypothetical protein
LKATFHFLSLLSQNQLLDAMGMSKPKVVCKTCGGLWGTLGHNNRCPQKVYTLEGKFCECGEPATTTSAVSSRPDPVCQRCHDIEKGGYRAVAPDSTSFGETYKLRLPRKNL